MKNGILIICITLFLIQCSSPDKQIYLSYYRMINNAEYSLFEGDTLQAIAQYEKATKMVERPFLRDLRTLISIKIKSFDTIDINETMELAIKLGASKKYLCCDSLINSEYRDNWDEYFPKYDSQRLEYFASIDTVYRKQIVELIQEDQKYRSLIESEVENLDSIRKANDYSILEKLMQLINEKGYFGYSVIGEDLLWGDNEDNFNDVFFRHMDPDTNKVYFYDILKQAVMNGDLYPDKYATIVDYDCIKSGKWEQIYGSCSFAYIDGNYAFPLINAKKIDSLRAEIGIRNWKEHLDITGLKYDDKIRPWE